MKKHITNFLSLAMLIVVLGLSSSKVNAQTYCAAAMSNWSADEAINAVSFNGVTLHSGLSASPQFKDYSASSFSALNNLSKGSTYSMSVTVNPYYGATDKTAAWIDWNQDGTFNNTLFSDGGERYDFTTVNPAIGSITVPSNAKAGNTRMRVRMQYGGTFYPCGSDYTSNVWGNVHDYTVSVFAPTSITTNLSSVPEQRCTSAGNRTLSIVVDGGGLNYNWQRSVDGVNWSTVQSGTSASYTVPVAADFANWQTILASPLTRQAQYRCAVTSSLGWGNVTSSIATIQANEPANAILPAISGACQGTPGSITATASGSYTLIQWQKSTDGINYSNITGATTPTLSFPATQLSDKGFYRCIMTNAATCGGTQYISSSCNFQVVELFTISSMPAANLIGCVDKDPVQITYTNTGTVYSYQWEISLDTGITWNNVTGNSSANTNSLVFLVPNKSQNGQYRCVMNYATCTGTADYTSPVTTYNVYNSFTINQQPTEQVVCLGSTPVLPVVAVGTVYGYRWKKDGVILSLEDNPYSQSAILYIENINHEQSGVYTCEVDAENCQTGRDWIPTKSVLVYVKRGTTITDINDKVEVMLGGVARISVEAHVANISRTEPVRVQWYKGGVALKDNDRIAGAKSSILTIRKIQVSDFANDYSVIVTGLCTADTAMNVTILEATTPVITVDAIANTTECVGKSVTMTATATMNVAGTLNYQWRANGTPLTNNAKHNGVTTNTLTVNNLDAADNATKYDVVVTSSDGKTTATSNEASVVVKPLATLSAKSNDVISVEAGKEINLSVTMASTLTLNYQWYVDNGSGTPTIITGATTNNLVIAAAAAADAGTYSVTVKSECDDQNITVSEVAVTMAGGANSVERGNLDLNITPNPTSEILNLNLSNIDYTSITITNTLGEVLFTTTNQTKVLNINVNELSLSNGIYLINVIGNKNYTGKFVVNK